MCALSVRKSGLCCVFSFVTNAALTKGALPLDDLQYDGGKRRSGQFCSTELGYETVTALCRVER